MMLAKPLNRLKFSSQRLSGPFQISNFRTFAGHLLREFALIQLQLADLVLQRCLFLNHLNESFPLQSKLFL
jgi:hypothetical protein